MRKIIKISLKMAMEKENKKEYMTISQILIKEIKMVENKCKNLVKDLITLETEVMIRKKVIGKINVLMITDKMVEISITVKMDPIINIKISMKIDKIIILIAPKIILIKMEIKIIMKIKIR